MDSPAAVAVAAIRAAAAVVRAILAVAAVQVIQAAAAVVRAARAEVPVSAHPHREAATAALRTTHVQVLHSATAEHHVRRRAEHTQEVITHTHGLAVCPTKYAAAAIPPPKVVTEVQPAEFAAIMAIEAVCQERVADVAL